MKLYINRFQINNFGSKTNKQSQMKNSKQLVVSMSGFVHDPQMPNYLGMLQQIGCKYVEQLSHDVNYLIVNHTCTQKYKIAQLSKSTTECITIKWLEDSAKNKKLLPIEKYKIKKIFYGIRAIVDGFEDKKMLDKIIELLKNNGVEEAKIGLQGMNTEEINEKYQLILIPSHRIYRKLQAKIAQFLSIPLVTPQWLQQSLNSKKCKYPNDYALNYHNLNTRLFDDPANVKRLNRKLQNFMEVDFLNEKITNLFYDATTSEQFIIYLDQNSIQLDFADLLKRLICVCGGLYLNTYGPTVTHILVGAIQQTEYHKLMNYGDAIPVLRVQWLVDSIIFAQRLPQVDFKVRSFKTPLIKSATNLQIRESFQIHRFTQHSQTFIHTFNTNPNAQFKNYTASLPIPPPIINKKSSKSISMPKQQPKPIRIIPASKIRAVKSDIFRGKYFYLEKDKKKQSFLMSIYTKIRQNGGYLFNETSINSLRNKKLFVVLKDSPQNQQYLESVHKLVPINNIQLIPISPRWIQECIKKLQFLQYSAQNYFTFKPFMFETPVRQLMTMKIQLLGIDEILKRRYRELLIALGCNKISPNISQITHCLCGKQYENDPRYKDIMQIMSSITKEKQKQTVSKDSSGSKTSIEMFVNTNIKMARVEWLMDMMRNKGKCNIDDYLINI